MSQENVEVVRNWLDASEEWFNAPGSADEELARIVDRYMAPDVTYEEDPVWPDAGTHRGQEAVSQRFVEYRDFMHLHGVSIGGVTDAGESIVAEVRIEMLGAESGEGIEFLWTYTVRVEDGRISHFRAWYDRAEALEAAGLRE
jgi:ketosteroid isomerase-like protein